MRIQVIVLAFLMGGCVSHEQQYASTLPSLRVGDVALRDGEPAIAASIADAHLAREPQDIDALLLRAKAEAALGENGPAAADFQQVLFARPRSEDAALGLARLILAGNPSAAEALLSPIAVRGTHNASVMNNLGVARDLLGRHQDAQVAYGKALEYDPGMRSAQVNLAKSLALTRGDAR